MSPLKRKLLRIFGIFIIASFLAGSIILYIVYHHAYEPNVNLKAKEHVFVQIPTGSDFEKVMEILTHEEILIHSETFRRMSKHKNYINRVRPGRYKITDSMSNNQLINLLRSGNQSPVNVTFNNIRTSAQLAGAVSRMIEADSLSVISLLSDAEVAASYGFTLETFPLMFIPNTYEFFWTTTASQLLERMQREHNRFWNKARLEKAKEINMTPAEVGILASIVQMETNKTNEMARIAGVYINRIKRGIPLQADPTVVFAMGDFTITRVLTRHLSYDSPYNTYRNAGLPPGPIALPSPTVMDFVLNYEKHEYIFFCAREDFSGYHSFAKTYSEHLANARRYQRALDELQSRQRRNAEQ
jgi:UPF0755 protein